MTRKKRQTQSKTSGQAPSRVRIIGGQWRSRLIAFPPIDGLRPTGDRVRETLFNWLAPFLANSRCLDAFAGSGALGFEALSRGAKEVVFIEQNPEAAKVLEQNRELLGASNARIIHGDAISVISKPHSSGDALNHQFDIVFIDPPFSARLHSDIMARLMHAELLAPAALVYLEKPVNEPLGSPEDWQLFKEKHSGSVCYQLWVCD